MIVIQHILTSLLPCNKLTTLCTYYIHDTRHKTLNSPSTLHIIFDFVLSIKLLITYYMLLNSSDQDQLNW